MNVYFQGGNKNITQNNNILKIKLLNNRTILSTLLI